MGWLWVMLVKSCGDNFVWDACILNLIFRHSMFYVFCCSSYRCFFRDIHLCQVLDVCYCWMLISLFRRISMLLRFGISWVFSISRILPIQNLHCPNRFDEVEGAFIRGLSWCGLERTPSSCLSLPFQFGRSCCKFWTFFCLIWWCKMILLRFASRLLTNSFWRFCSVYF